MFRTILITFATLLAGGAIVLSRQIPVKPNMKKPTQVLIGMAFFFMLFFAAVRFIDDYFWWSVPAVAFIGVFYYGFRRLDEIRRLIARERPDPWLVQLNATSRAASGAIEEKIMRDEWDATVWEEMEEPETYDSDLLFGDEEPPPRRYLDDYFVADEADLGPHDLDLERLDEFIFTARHGYLVHDHNPDRAPCDVMTVSPGMSIADLIEAAEAHECVKEQ